MSGLPACMFGRGEAAARLEVERVGWVFGGALLGKGP